MALTPKSPKGDFKWRLAATTRWGAISRGLAENGGAPTQCSQA